MMTGVMSLKMEGEATSQGIWQPPGAENARKQILPYSLLKERTLTLAQRN